MAAMLIVAASTVLSGCSSSSRSALQPTVGGTSTGVALTTSTGTTQVQVGAALVVNASVTNDLNAAGVKWTLVGDGTLSNATLTSVTYTAPSTLAGSTTPISGTDTAVITATSIAKPTTAAASATLVVLGTPLIEDITLFPGNVGTAYGAAISVSGGLAPFTWSLASGTLPPGVTLGTTATTAFTTLSGTPTTAGPYHFSVKVVDKNGATTTAKSPNSPNLDLLLPINAAQTCLLSGQYAMLYTGFTDNQFAVSAASLTVSPTGSVSGRHDYRSSSTTVSETVTGTCNTRTANNGTLTLSGGSYSPTYDYAVTAGIVSLADPRFVGGRVQLLNGGNNQAGAGLLLLQDKTAFSSSSILGATGASFAFGGPGGQTDSTQAGIAGAVLLDASGNAKSGRVDTNGTSPLSGALVTGGALSAPDTAGHGTLTLIVTPASGGTQTFTFAYYIVTANKLFLVSSETATSAPRFAGFMTRQTGTTATGTFDAASLSGAAIMSLWGASGTTIPKTVLTLGRLSNPTATAGSTTGSVDMVLDYMDHIAAALATAVPAVSYSVDSDGRGALTYTAGGGSHALAFYLDGPSNGYIVEHGSTAGTAGLLEAQQSGPFKSTIPGLFVSGTQYAMDVAPVVLLPSVHFSAGTISSSYATGNYSTDSNGTTGRGVGTLSVTGSGNSVFILYQINPNKVVTLRLGATNRDAVIDWFGS